MSVELLLITLLAAIGGAIVGSLVGVWIAGKLIDWWDGRRPR